MQGEARPPTLLRSAWHRDLGVNVLSRVSRILKGFGKESSWPWVIIALYGVIALITFDYIEEDAFIYYRVAANIADGYGYVFNVGGERIEVGSSLVWQYLLAFLCFCRLDLIVASKVAGVVLGGATLYLVARISAKIIEDRWLRLAAPALLAVAVPFYGWVQRGLETPLYVFAVVLLAYFVLEKRLQSHWYVPALLVAFSRSEGLFALTGLAGFFYFERSRLRCYARGALILLAAIALAYAWRVFYFHDFVPHAFYTKILESNGYGRGSSITFFKTSWTWLIAVPAALGLVLRRARQGRELIVLAVLDAPLMWWGFTTQGYQEFNRHLSPALPLMYILIAAGLDGLLVALPRLRLPVHWGMAAFILWSAAYAPALDRTVKPQPNLLSAGVQRVATEPRRFVSQLAALAAVRPRGVVNPDEYISDHITANWQYLVGDFIARTYPRHSVIAYDQMGQTPWYAGQDKVFIDTWGLTNRMTGFAIWNRWLDSEPNEIYEAYRDITSPIIAKWDADLPSLRQQQAVDRIFAMQPHLIILNTIIIYKPGPDGAPALDTRVIPGMIAQDPRLKARYVERTKWYLRFYERKDIVPLVHWKEVEQFTPGKADRTIDPRVVK